MTPFRLVSPLLAAATLAAVAGPAAAAPTLRLDGIGPLRLGMGARAALATRWLAQRAPGCELAGPPVPVTYRLTGPRAPRGVRGSAELHRGRVVSITVTRGVRTRAGVAPGRTRVAGMVGRYRRAGFTVTAQFEPTFGATFVFVRRGRRPVLGGVATRGIVRTIGVPFVPVCE